MSHPRDLIDRLLAALWVDYPPDQFSFVIEKTIPGTRMMPDVQVRTADGRIVCVAEVGYTRPEKLTAYRKDLKIPDVRWYDKKVVLHADVETRHIVAEVELRPVGEFSLYLVFDRVQCPHCKDRALDDPDDDVEQPEDFGSLEDYEYFLSLDVLTAIVVGPTRAWLPSLCDKCGQGFLADESSELFDLDLSSIDGRTRATMFGARVLLDDWNVVSRRAREETGVEFGFEDGLLLAHVDPSTERVPRVTILKNLPLDKA